MKETPAHVHSPSESAPRTFESGIPVHPVSNDGPQQQHGAGHHQPIHGREQQAVPVQLHQENSHGEVPHSVPLGFQNHIMFSLKRHRWGGTPWWTRWWSFKQCSCFTYPRWQRMSHVNKEFGWSEEISDGLCKENSCYCCTSIVIRSRESITTTYHSTSSFVQSCPF